jgi:starch synthase
VSHAPLRVLFIASELAPHAKTGGLGDVITALPRALARLGASVRIVLPYYRALRERQSTLALARRLTPLRLDLGGEAMSIGVIEGKLPGSTVELVLLDHPPYFDRPGLYGEGGADYNDNALRFGLLAKGAVEVSRQLGPWPDVVHAHDWQAALAPLYFHERADGGHPLPSQVLTIHNLAFQGLFPRETLPALGLDWSTFTPEGVEFYGQVSFLKAGVVYADRIATVSPRYAREIRTAEFGCGLDGLLRSQTAKVRGILNGGDYEVWTPEHDRLIDARYDDEDLSGKEACKAALQRELGLPVRPRIPLLGVVSRLTEQKGMDLLATIAPELCAADMQICLLGAGDSGLETRFSELGRRQPQRAAVRIGYDETLAHRVVAGSDIFLMPSRFEPCGLTQIYSLRYGTIPIVRGTGGLDDTIVDYDRKTRTGSGFKFGDATPAALLSAIRRAVRVYAEDHVAWLELQRRAMRLDYSWTAAARSYLELYDEATKERLRSKAS